MDVLDPRFGNRNRDRDDFAIQVQNVFKRFLQEFTGEQNPDDSVEGEEEIRDDVTNDSFSSARSRPAARQAGASQSQGKPVASKYSAEALQLLNDYQNTLYVDFKDVEMFDDRLAEDIIMEYYRFYNYLCRALASYVREERIRQSEASMDPNADVAELTREREAVKKILDKPQIVNKDYYIGFYNFPHRDNIRDLSCTRIGVLTRVTGQVVRTHISHPELVIGHFKCLLCFSEQYCQQQFRYTQPNRCSNDACNNASKWELDLKKSRFTDFQRLRIQETQQELPRGCIPRSFDVIVRGSDQVECIQPGDQVDFVGTLISLPDVGQMMSGAVGTVSKEMSQDAGVTGLKGTGVKEMYYTLAFLANSCTLEGQYRPCSSVDNQRDNFYDSSLEPGDFTKEEIAKIEKMSKDTSLLNNLSQSLFTSIYGSEDIKRGVLLQLLGGVPKRTSTGTKLRGDINVCLVGDPSTAKSQFLKIVTDFAPVKAVFASGKASSASGLTAAVVRDHDGGFVIEAGALMLADRGICCIDEFDKMDLKDQVALHEAMEQQTISITKAGVSATLNARASILAAANPIGSTYNTHRDLRSNLSFSLPIMSRFDLFFVIVDNHDKANDIAISTRICQLHSNFDRMGSIKQEMVYSFEDIRLYLRFARKYYPRIPIECEMVFINEYVRLRSSSLTNRTAFRTTVRQFESLVRLSEAIARAHCSEIVKPEYIKQAASLIEKTLISVGESEIDLTNTDDQKLFGGDQQATQGMYDGELESQRLDPTQTVNSQQKVKMSLPEYKGMAEVLISKLRNVNMDPNRETIGMKQSELVDWYLHQCVSEISTESDLIWRKQLCEKVIERLVKKDNHLMRIREDGKILDPSQPEEDADEEDPHLIVNPTNDADDDPESFFTQAIS